MGTVSELRGSIDALLKKEGSSLLAPKTTFDAEYRDQMPFKDVDAFEVIDKKFKPPGKCTELVS